MALRVKWQPFAAGLLVAAVGYGLLHLGGSGLFEGGVLRPPSVRVLLLMLTGSLLLLIGVLTALIPNVLILLRAIYGADFGRRVVCPVMVACPSCSLANVRGKARCQDCGGSLEGARALGGTDAA